MRWCSPVGQMGPRAPYYALLSLGVGPSTRRRVPGRGTEHPGALALTTGGDPGAFAGGHGHSSGGHNDHSNARRLLGELVRSPAGPSPMPPLHLVACDGTSPSQWSAPHSVPYCPGQILNLLRPSMDFETLTTCEDQSLSPMKSGYRPTPPALASGLAQIGL
jgi:hypothetical protein